MTVYCKLSLVAISRDFHYNETVGWQLDMNVIDINWHQNNRKMED